MVKFTQDYFGNGANSSQFVDKIAKKSKLASLVNEIRLTLYSVSCFSNYLLS